MPGVAVNALDAAGGAQQTQANPWFRVEGEPIVVIGDLVTAHGDPPHSPPPPMVSGAGWYRVANIAVCRAGDTATCGHATSGRPWFRVA